MKQIKFIIIIFTIITFYQCDPNATNKESISTIQLENLRCEYRVSPLGIDILKPRLSWILQSNEKSQKQTSYQIIVSSTEEKLAINIGDLWDSDKVDSDQSIHVIYQGKELQSQIQCFWKVRIWDKNGNISSWSPPAVWSMGLLHPSDWKAKWIGQDMPENTLRNDFQYSKWIWFPGGNPAEKTSPGTRYFRRTLIIPKSNKIIKAQYLITADNRFSLYANGQFVGKGDNAITGYKFDVSNHLHPGKNILAVAATNRGPEDNGAGLIGTLRVEIKDDETIILPMDKQWKTSSKEISGWKENRFDDSDWISSQEIGDCGIHPWGDISITEVKTRLPARMLRNEFTLSKKVKRATAYVCGLGFFELHLNGKKVEDHVMDPGLTNYDKRLLYVTFDVTNQLKSGINAVGTILGNGRFFAPRTSMHVGTLTFGYPKLLLQMHIEYEDGSTQEIVSDENWKLTTDGPIRANNEYDGEDYDARKQQVGWNSSGFNDSKWKSANLVESPKGYLQSQMIDPIRITEIIKPVGITNPGVGTYIVDMGQTFYGTFRIKVNGVKGSKVVIRSAYNLKTDGNLKTEDNRGALCTDSYILNGKSEEVWQPIFKGQGFRYLEVTGFPGKPTVENFKGLVIHTDMDEVGSFECSNPLLNKLYTNIRWGQRMYRRSVPLDPDRDERQGWLGDPAKDAESDAYNFNVASFYAKWLQDIRMDQRVSGELPDVSPIYYPFYNKSIVWPSVISIIPEWYYNFYGDKQILSDNYDSMKKFISFVSDYHQKEDFTVDYNRYGDWCDTSTMGSGEEDPIGATSRSLISTSYHYNNVLLASRIAKLLGKTEDEIHYAELANNIKTGFNDRFFDPKTNTYESKTQTSYVLPLAFGLVPLKNKEAVIANLAEDIMVNHKGHLSVGLIGIQWLMQVLSDIGHPEVAYTIATQTTQPGWGYMISKGATSIWERWDSDTRGPGMNSEGLLMLAGNLEAWFYQTLAGINYDKQQPGFKNIILKPQPVGDLTFAKAKFQSLYGWIHSGWKISNNTFSWNISIPVNTTATIYIPSKNANSIKESERSISKIKGIKFIGMENGAAVYTIGSGKYSFLSEI